MGVVAVEGQEPFDVCPNPKTRKPPPGTTLVWTTPQMRGEDPVPDVKGSPLLELNSVHISGHQLRRLLSRRHAPFPDGVVLVWGHIILTDDLGNSFTLFTRDEIDPLLIEPSSDGPLSLGGPRCLPSKFSFKFQLLLQPEAGVGHPPLRFDEISALMDCSSDVLYDELQQAYVGTKSDHVHACVKFTVHRCSVLANTGFVIEKKTTKTKPKPKLNDDDDDDCDDSASAANVSGQIHAVYQNSCSKKSSSSSMNQRMNRNIIFNFNLEHSRLELGNFIQGPRLGVPAYSTCISFEFSRFYVQGEFIDDYTTTTLEFDTLILWGYSFEKQIHGQKYLIRFILSWDFPMNVLPERICQYHVDDKSIIVPKKIYKRRKTTDCPPIYIQPHVESLNKTRWWISNGLCEEAVEIFSIYICAYNKPNRNQPLNLKGSTSVFELEKESVVCKCVTLLDSGDTLLYPQGIDHCFMGGYFSIEIKYEDDDGHEFCNGLAEYTEYTVDSWFNRRICSVIKGMNGYAALHYTIFGNALEAKLRFELSPCFPSACRVIGKITTRYDNFRYSTDYEKKYYQSRLFENLDEGVIVQGGNNEIPLLKSAVAVPFPASLIVELDIVFKYAQEEEEEPFSTKVSFSSQMILDEIDESSKVTILRMPGKHASLLVHVNWARVGYS